MTQRTSSNPHGALAPNHQVKRAVRAVVGLAVIVVGLSAEPAVSGEASTTSPDTARSASPSSEAVNELQRQVNELRSDMLDEREKRIVGWQVSNGTVFAFLGIVIGIGGLWAYAKFRAITTVAATGVALERGYAFSAWDALPQPGTAPVSSGKAFQPVRLLVPAGPEVGDPSGMRNEPGSRHAMSDPAAAPDSPEDQEVLAECTEAIRLDPEHPHAWIERGDVKARHGQYEGSIADYDEAIRLDPDMTATLGDV